MITLTFPDGAKREIEQGLSAAQVAAGGARLAADHAAQGEQPGQWSGQAAVNFSGE